MSSQAPAMGVLPPVAKQVNPVDIVFCVDCTASMGPCFEGLVKHLHDFVTGLQSENRVDFRLRLIEYRDLKINEPTTARDFTNDVEEFKGQLQKLSPSGGGDEPESTFDAIYTALNSPWRTMPDGSPAKCHKAVLAFTDAPSHPDLHESTVPAGVPRDIETVINLLESKRTWLYLVSVEDPLYDRLSKREKTIIQLYPKDRRYEGLKGVDFAQVLEWFGRSISNVSGLAE
jgi:von Willebrand factor type A domain